MKTFLPALLYAALWVASILAGSTLVPILLAVPAALLLATCALSGRRSRPQPPTTNNRQTQ